jgi:hypothetical protein
MATAPETRACRACATAKRRCGKEIPHCLRCRERGVECTYLSARPTCFVLSEGDGLFQVEHPVHSRGADYSTLSFSPDLPKFPSDVFDSLPYASWFTSPETWKIDRSLLLEFTSSTVVSLKGLLSKFHRWLTEWVEMRSNPFIHSRLYRTRFPRSVQDAYTALSCYLHKSTSNEQIMFQIIEDRAKRLVVEHTLPPADSLEHLARVQALLIYQVLCLYDGDIRLRHIAESNIPVLYSCMEQMVEHASNAICLGSSIISSPHEQTTVGSCLSDIHCENLLWYSWILAESIRRTWLVASGVQGTYLVIQQGRAIPCQGGMMITTRQGAWEAKSAGVWEKLCPEVNVGLMQVAETDRLFAEAAPEDVDDFAMLILQATFGEERLERWGIHIHD